MKLVYSNYPKHGINGYLRKGRQILCFGLIVKNVICCFPATVLYVYIDFCQQVKTTIIINTCAFCTQIFLECRFKIDFKLVLIVECLCGRKQVKVVQIPMTKADQFLAIFEAIPGTVQNVETLLKPPQKWFEYSLKTRFGMSGKKISPSLHSLSTCWGMRHLHAA